MALLRLFLLIVLLSICAIAKAEETDQFTLPPIELFDIGPIASQRLYEVIENIITQTNYKIQMLQQRASLSRLGASQLASRLNGAYLADLVYERTGPGFPRWLRGLHAPNKLHPILYNETWPWNNVYWLVFSQSPLSLMSLAPTLNMYGYNFGTDKLGHFFMMGHTYYKIYMFYLSHWHSAKKAHEAIVTYGQILEHTYLGTLVNGVFSNGDLAANYSGWKFYMNLTQRVKIGDKILPPILILKDGQWRFSKHINKENLLKPYISDNLNEALNPCRYAFMRGQIRKQVKKRCADWIGRKAITKEKIEAKLKETSLWHGEVYGHWLPNSNAVTLNTCFD